jgi:Tfp pilus assembly protein PilZ
MAHELESDRNSNFSDERRAAPRVQLVSPISGRTDAGDAVLLVNVSEGGLLVHTDQPMSVGTTHVLRFSPADASDPLVVSARVVHVMRISAVDDASYVVGLQFVDATPAQQQAFARLVAGPVQQANGRRNR